MSDLDVNLQRVIELIIDKRVPVSVSLGTVSAIDKKNDTCKINLSEGQDLFNVRLRSIIEENDSKWVVYPEDGSTVVVILIENSPTEAMLLNCSKIEEMVLKIGERSLVANKNGFIFDEGKNKGAVKVSEMVSWMNKVKTDLTAISVALNGLGAPVVISTPAAQLNQFENDKLKH